MDLSPDSDFLLVDFLGLEQPVDVPEVTLGVGHDYSENLVLRNGSGVLSSSEDTENKLIFRGGENWLQYQRFYSQLFQCNFFLHWYPFDYQV